MNKTLSFESNKKKKQQLNLLDQTKNKIRLSEVIKQEIKEQSNDNENFMEINSDQINDHNYLNIESKKKKNKRQKTKSKGEIRDKFDRMIATTRNKPQLPPRTKTKWFE